MKKIIAIIISIVVVVAALFGLACLYFTYTPSDIPSETKKIVTVKDIRKYEREYNDSVIGDFKWNRKFKDQIETTETEPFAVLTTVYTNFYKLDEDNKRVKTSFENLKPGDTLEVWVSSTTTFGGELIEATEITVLKSKSKE